MPESSASKIMLPGSPVHQWLKKQREAVHGHMSQWPAETMDTYHRDLGLLIDFVTDCWPPSKAILLAEAAQALDDWILVYAAKFCDESEVKAAWDRIMAKDGVLVYASDLRDRLLAETR